MAILDFNPDDQKSDLIVLIKKVKGVKPDLGAYIEHFHYSDDIIIVKLTNGFIKINEDLLLKHQADKEMISHKELTKIADTFVQTVL